MNVRRKNGEYEPATFSSFSAILSNIELTFMLSDCEFGVPVSYSVNQKKKKKIISAVGRTGECFDRAKPGHLWLGDKN